MDEWICPTCRTTLSDDSYKMTKDHYGCSKCHNGVKYYKKITRGARKALDEIADSNYLAKATKTLRKINFINDITAEKIAKKLEKKIEENEAFLKRFLYQR